jgi:hypothetical protein
VVPLYSPNIDSNKVGNLTSLITSEVDFSGQYDMVSQVSQRPKSLTPKCLKSVSCLRPIAQQESVESLVVGSVTRMGSELEFFIVLYDSEKIIRMKRFKIKDEPLIIAAEMGGFVQEVLTGKAQAPEEDEESAGEELSDMLDEEGDIFGDEDLGDFSLDPEEEARKEAARKEDIRKKEMEEQARRIALEAEASRLAKEAQEETEDFDFDFAPSTVEVVDKDEDTIVEEEDMVLNFDSPKKSPKAKKPKVEERENNRSFEDFGPSSSSSKSKNSSRNNAAATLSGKVGIGNFQTLNFVTYGGEVGIHLSDAVSIQIAGEGFATNQSTPVLDENGETTDLIQQSWRVLIPISFGAIYHFEGKMLKPYLGADLQVLPAYAGSGSGAAVGLRARAGGNFMVSDGFGINVNIGFGFWNGQYFSLVPSPTGGVLNPTGFTPQLSVGPLVTF